MAQDHPDRGFIRVGHRERDAVAEVLQEAAGDGRLDLTELDVRLEAALKAKTYADLDPLVADLSTDVPSRALDQPPPIRSAPSAGYSREDPLRLDAGMSSEKRRGVWTVPPFLVINPGLGSVKLNCLEAIPAAQLIEIAVIGGAGSILLVLPDGWGADTDRLSKSMGSRSVKVPRDPAPGKPLLIFHGSLGLGQFKVRPPHRSELRRIARMAKRRQLTR
jgi:hypothetical protein